MSAKDYHMQEERFAKALEEIMRLRDASYIMHKVAGMLELASEQPTDKFGRRMTPKRKAELKLEAYKVLQLARYTMN